MADLSAAYLVRIGSWSAQAFLEADADATLLNEIFKLSVNPPDASSQVDARLEWSHAASTERTDGVPPDGLVVKQTAEQSWCIESEFLSLRAELAAPLPQIRLTSYPHLLEPLAWRVHVSVVLQKLLLLLGRSYVHAGAVQIGCAASAFIAEKGSGKSTICMRLGGAGATILSDDHIVIRREQEGFQVSGCEQVARVTAVTEAALLPQRLAVEAQDFGGSLKKEFRVSDVFAALPYHDVPLKRVFFPHIGTRFQIMPLARRALLPRLLTTTRSSHRFANAQDYERHLDYFSALAQAVAAFDLELSPDLSALDSLVEFLDV